MLIWRKPLNPGAEITGFFAAIRETALTSEKDVGKDKAQRSGDGPSFGPNPGLWAKPRAALSSQRSDMGMALRLRPSPARSRTNSPPN